MTAAYLEVQNGWMLAQPLGSRKCRLTQKKAEESAHDEGGRRASKPFISWHCRPQELWLDMNEIAQAMTRNVFEGES